MKTKETIRADIFIIPNPSFVFKGSMAQEIGLDPSLKRFQRVWYSLADSFREGKEFATESWIQVWFVTPGSDDSNWSCHKIDGYPELKGWKPVCGYLPKSLFEGHKEGDCITVDLPIEKWEKTDDDITITYATTIKVCLCLAQSKYRYRDHGTFEKVLNRI